MICELLAPAGNRDALKAAIEAGADAVYLAGSRFGARAYAGNFADDELAAAVKFAQLRGVAVHVTVNTLVFDRETDKLAEYLQFLAEIGADAVLLQDLGATRLAKRVAPHLALHASTQMTAHNLSDVMALAELGFSRVVLARELSLEEIKYITAKSPIEIEIFMHGALCVCYSGQCLMSSQIFGRSANRGRCAQPCRLPYTLVRVDGNRETPILTDKYLLSPRDLNTLDILPELVESGVASLKIEGRMKRAEYVATVTQIYRRALDSCRENKAAYRVAKDDADALALAFNRDFTHAFLKHGSETPTPDERREMMSYLRPNNRGLLVGRVTAYDAAEKKATVKLSGALGVGDETEFWVKVGGRVTAKINALTDKSGRTVNHAATGDTVSFGVPRKVSVGDRLFKVYDDKLSQQARQLYGKASTRRIGITARADVNVGQPLNLTLVDEDGNSTTQQTNFVAEKAVKHALTAQILRQQTERLGTSVFMLKDFAAEIGEGVMMPISEINDVRRRAVAALEQIRIDAHRKQNRAEPNEVFFAAKTTEQADEPKDLLPVMLLATAHSLQFAQAAVAAGADAVLLGTDMKRGAPISVDDMARAAQFVHESGKEIYLAMPRVVPAKYLNEVRKLLAQADAFDAVYVHSAGMLRLARESTDTPIRADWSIVCGNVETLRMLRDMGASGATLSPELTMAQINELAKCSPLPLECIVDGRQELMVSKYCVPAAFAAEQRANSCGGACQKGKYFLKDRKGIMFPLITDRFCLMHILNSKPLSMLAQIPSLRGGHNTGNFLPLGKSLRRLRLVPRHTDELAEIKTIAERIKLYKHALNGTLTEEKISGYERDITRGGLFRGVE